MLYFLTALFYIAVALKTLLIRTQYEQHSMSGLKNFVTLFPGYFNIYSNKQFLLHCFTRYYWIPLATAAIARHYKSHREWRKLVFFCFSVCGYLLLVNISYPTPVTPSFYIENLYLPVGVFLALPFVFDLLPALLIRQSALPVFILILISGCIRLYTSHTIFTRRLDLEREIIARYGSRKVILDAKNVDTNALQMLWGTPYECLLLSVSDHHPPASIIIDGNPDIRIYDGTHNNALVVNYNIVPYRDLNPRYFKFTDTSTIYAIIHNE
jgi:hypothetical protein